MPLSTSLRRLGFGLSTVTGLARRGFFIPYRLADTLPPGGGRDVAPVIGTWFGLHEAAFTARLAGLAEHAEALAALTGPAPEPRWRQDWFPRLDGAVAYAMVRDLRPRRIVEIGSGHSTRFLARAVRDGGLDTAIATIDPAPRADLAGVSVTLHRTVLQQAPAAPFDALDDGDFLFVDSSHVLVPGSDVDFLIGRILPRLPAGVVLHFHDIFLPDDYPAAWGWRGYNEQGAVAALMTGGGFMPLFASHYVATRLASAVAESVAGRLPLPDGAVESSLWLRKLVPPLV